MDFSALKYATIILIVIAGVFLAVSTGVNQIDPAALPAPLQEFAIKLQIIFAMPAVVFITTWVRNVYGYYRAKAKALGKNQQVNYDLNRLYQTIALYVGSAAVFLSTIPPPYDVVALAVIFVLDILRSEIAGILKQS